MDPVSEVLVIAFSLTATMFGGAALALWMGRQLDLRFASWLGRRSAAEHQRLWREAAAAAGLAGLEGDGNLLEGRSGPLRVRFSTFSEGPIRGTRITVEGGPEELSVTHENFTTRMQKRRGVLEVETGDEAFDAAAWVQGPPALALAVLDTKTRHELTGLLSGQLRRPRLAAFWAEGHVQNGRLTVDVPELYPLRAADVTSALPPVFDPVGEAAGDAVVADRTLFPAALLLVLSLAHRLKRPQDVAAQLAGHLRTEPEGRVRVRQLQALIREFPDHPATLEALRAACDDPEAEVRLEAAVALGAEKRDVLLQLAHGEGAEDAVTARAVAALEDVLTLEQAESILRDALRIRRLATAERCLALLGRRGGAEAIAMLARVLAVETPELAVAAARALASTGEASTSAPLLTALDHADVEVRLAATQGLGRVGTAAEVQRLKQVEAEDRALRTAARQAIAEIQSRLAGAEPGQLSLAPGQSGQLSMADEEQGRLSLPEPAAAAARAPALAGEKH